MFPEVEYCKVKPRYYRHRGDQKECPYYGVSLLSGFILFKENVWSGTKFNKCVPKNTQKYVDGCR